MPYSEAGRPSPKSTPGLCLGLLFLSPRVIFEVWAAWEAAWRVLCCVGVPEAVSPKRRSWSVVARPVVDSNERSCIKRVDGLASSGRVGAGAEPEWGGAACGVELSREDVQGGWAVPEVSGVGERAGVLEGAPVRALGEFRSGTRGARGLQFVRGVRRWSLGRRVEASRGRRHRADLREAAPMGECASRRSCAASR